MLCGLIDAVTIPDWTTVWVFENRIGEAGARALFRRRIGAVAQSVEGSRCERIEARAEREEPA